MSGLHAFLRPVLTAVALGVAAAGALLASDQVWLLCLGAIFLCLLYLIWSLVPPLAPRTRAALGGLVSPEERDQARQAGLSRSVQQLAGFLLAGFLLLGVHLLRQQVTQGDAIAHSRVINTVTADGAGGYTRDTTLIRNGQVVTFTRPITVTAVQTGTDSLQNPRLLSRGLRVQRGRIRDASGRVIAGRQVYSGTDYVQRTYPVANMSYLLGYYNPTIYGLAGLENAYDSYLSGDAASNPVVDEENRVLHRPVVGADVQLTLVPAIQDAATTALGAQRGAVVVLNAQSGAILALVSYPHFDPNGLAFNPNADDWAVENHRIVDYWNTTVNRSDLPMLDRATQGLYPPGSTFKIVTSSTAFQSGRYNPQTLVYAPTSLQLPQTTNRLTNSNGEICGNGSGHVPLIDAFTQSCNTAFGALGMKLGGAALKQQADKFGMNSSSLTIPMPVSPSNYVQPPSQALTAYSAIGQFSDTVTPMQEAMFAATIANHGTLMKPYLVQNVKAPDLTTVQQASSTVLSQPVSASSASGITSMMLNVVNSPIGTAHNVPGILGLDIAAKTGTAQNGANNTGLNDAVFTAFAPASNPVIAVGVIIKGGGYGADAAGPIALQVIKAYERFLRHG